MQAEELGWPHAAGEFGCLECARPPPAAVDWAKRVRAQALNKEFGPQLPKVPQKPVKTAKVNSEIGSIMSDASQEPAFTFGNWAKEAVCEPLFPGRP